MTMCIYNKKGKARSYFKKDELTQTSTLNQAYRTASGGGARIVDKYSGHL